MDLDNGNSNMTNVKQDSNGHSETDNFGTSQTISLTKGPNSSSSVTFNSASSDLHEFAENAFPLELPSGAALLAYLEPAAFWALDMEERKFFLCTLESFIRHDDCAASKIRLYDQSTGRLPKMFLNLINSYADWKDTLPYLPDECLQALGRVFGLISKPEVDVSLLFTLFRTLNFPSSVKHNLVEALVLMNGGTIHTQSCSNLTKTSFAELNPTFMPTLKSYFMLGGNGACIRLPNMMWPFANEYQVAFWIRFEKFHAANDDSEKVHMLTFVTDDDNGVDFYLDGQSLFVSIEDSQDGDTPKKLFAIYGVSFSPSRWYSVIIHHRRALGIDVFGSDAMQVVIDGSTAFSGHVPFPSKITQRCLTKCTLGENLEGQIGGILMYSPAEEQSTIQLKLTSIMDSSNSNTASWFTSRDFSQSKLKIRGGSSKGNFFVGYIPNQYYKNVAWDLGTGGIHGILKGAVRVWNSCGSAKDVIHNLGGIQALLPLFHRTYVTANNDDNVPLSLLLDVLTSFIQDSMKNLKDLAQEGILDIIEYIITISPTDSLLHAQKDLPEAAFALWYACSPLKVAQKSAMQSLLANWGGIWCYCSSSTQYAAAEALLKVVDLKGSFAGLKVNAILTGVKLARYSYSHNEGTDRLLSRVLTAIMLNECREIGEALRFVAACKQNRIAAQVLFALGDMLRRPSVPRSVLEELESACSVDITIGISQNCVPLGLCEFLLQQCKALGPDCDALRGAAIRMLNAYAVQIVSLYKAVPEKMRAALRTLFGSPEKPNGLKESSFLTSVTSEAFLSLRMSELFSILLSCKANIGEFTYAALLEMSISCSKWQPWNSDKLKYYYTNTSVNDPYLLYLTGCEEYINGVGCPAAASVILQVITLMPKKVQVRSCRDVRMLIGIAESGGAEGGIPWGSLQRTLLVLISPLFDRHDEAYELKDEESHVKVLKLYTSMLEGAMKEDEGYRELETVVALQWLIPGGKTTVQTLLAKVAARLRRSKKARTASSTTTTSTTEDGSVCDADIVFASANHVIFSPLPPPPYPLWDNMAHLAFLSASLAPTAFHETFAEALTRHNPDFKPLSLSHESENSHGAVVLSGHVLKLFDVYLGEGEYSGPLIWTHCLVGQQGPLLRALLRLSLLLMERLPSCNALASVENGRRLNALLGVLLFPLHQQRDSHYAASSAERNDTRGLAASSIICILEAVASLWEYAKSLFDIQLPAENLAQPNMLVLDIAEADCDIEGMKLIECQASLDFSICLCDIVVIILDAFPEFGIKDKFAVASSILSQQVVDALEVWRVIAEQLCSIHSYDKNGIYKEVLYEAAGDAVVNETKAMAAMAERLAYRWREVQDNVRTVAQSSSVSSVLIGMLQHEYSRTAVMVDQEYKQRLQSSAARWEQCKCFMERAWSPWTPTDTIGTRWRVSLHKDSMMRQMLLVPDLHPVDLSTAAYDFKNEEQNSKSENTDESFLPLPPCIFPATSIQGDVNESNGSEPILEKTFEANQLANSGLEEMTTEVSAEAEHIDGGIFEGEEIHGQWITTMVLPQCLIDGVLLITATRLHFYATARPRQHGGSVDINGSDEFAGDLSFDHSLSNIFSKANRKEHARTWRLNRLKRVCLRRYLLSPCATELYWFASHEVFLSFAGVRQRQHFTVLLQLARTPLCVWPPSLHPRQVIKAERYTELWRRRQISNFEYIMRLNVAAGRSYNDITQYPVFPWVLQDYKSESIDLENPDCYRDLSKPIGALNPARLKSFIERYHSFEDANIPKFLYGSHYSSAGIILHYLIRQEPFASMHVALQGGHFDCPDRLFFDICQSWKGCLRSMSDVKELVPEFYCFPEALLNTNSLPLGNLQEGGTPIKDVRLPPWAAKGGAHEFVRILRKAFESDVVSRQLHLWIDLVFGCKQSPASAALAADNLFYYLTYEGAVDISSIPDATQRKATEAQIAHFGQTPSQLFAEPHPPRLSRESCESSCFDNPARVQMIGLPQPDGHASLHGAILSVLCTKEFIIIVHADFTVVKYNISQMPNGSGLPFTIGQDFCLRIPPYSDSLSAAMVYTEQSIEANTITIVSPPAMPSIGRISLFRNFGVKKAASFVGQNKEHQENGYGDDKSLSILREECKRIRNLCGHHQFGIRSSEGLEWLVSCGYWNMGMKIHDLERGLLELGESVDSAGGKITCLDVDDDGTMVTGGLQGFLRVWVVGNSGLAEALHTNEGSPFVSKSAAHPAHRLYGHEADISCLALSTSLDIVFSCAMDARITVHRVQKGRHVRSLFLPGCPPPVPTQSSLTPHGDCVLHAASSLSLHVISLNGTLIASIQCDSILSSLVSTCDGEYVVCGGYDGAMTLRRISDLSPVRVLEGQAAITSMSFGPRDGYLVVGHMDGTVSICVDVQQRLGMICASLEEMYV